METVLLVEDEEAVRVVLARVLRTAGYTLLVARDGQEALELLAQHEGPLDLLLTDVVMPGLNGRELAERVAADRPDTKVLFMSGYTNDLVLREGISTAETHFIAKPYSRQDMLLKIRSVLDV
jgi:CheY-like chemotaxis protein